MRHLALLSAASLASFAALALAACGTAPSGTEKSASESQGIIIPKCPAGSAPQCSGDGPRGQEICTCVPLPPPPVCNWVTPTVYENSYVQSWSVASPNGECPPIPGKSGSWQNLQPVEYVPGGFDGVPCELHGYPNLPVSTCSQFFPGQACCTYVWWPAGFVAPSTQVSQSEPIPGCNYPQDQQALCQTSGTTFYATLGMDCERSDAGDGDGGFDGCRGNGGSSCNTCSRPAGSP